MEDLNTYINESLLDDEDNLIDSINAIPNIESWIKRNTAFNKDLLITQNKNGEYIVNAAAIAMNKNAKSLTNGMFKWGKIYNEFNCNKCNKLKNLNGGPIECFYFCCKHCQELEDIKEGPQICDEFDCTGCSKLKSLEGAPKECEVFICSNCEGLSSFKGSPKKCDYFYGNSCPQIKSLEGAPKRCKTFSAYNCGCEWSTEDMKKYHVLK